MLDNVSRTHILETMMTTAHDTKETGMDSWFTGPTDAQTTAMEIDTEVERAYMQTIRANPSMTLAECESACTPNGDCEGVMFDGTTCTQITSELDPDYTGFVHVTGAVLKSYLA